MSAFSQAIQWYLRDHRKLGEFATKLLGSQAVKSLGGETSGEVDDWREQFWWAQRNQPPKLLDIRAADAIQNRFSIPDSDLAPLRARFHRDVESFRGALTDAFEDDIIEVREADALEVIRLDCCISRREATKFVEQLRSPALISKAPWPTWLEEGLRRENSGNRTTIRVDESSGSTEAIQPVLKSVGEFPVAATMEHQLPVPEVDDSHQSTLKGSRLPANSDAEFRGLRHLLSKPPMERAELLAGIILKSEAALAESVVPEKVTAAHTACEVRPGEVVVFLFDLTLLGSAADACLLTSDALYIRNPWYSPHEGLHRIDWTEFASTEIKIREAEVVLDAGHAAIFIWSWNEQKLIKRVLKAIQQYLRVGG